MTPNSFNMYSLGDSSLSQQKLVKLPVEPLMPEINDFVVTNNKTLSHLNEDQQQIQQISTQIQYVCNEVGCKKNYLTTSGLNNHKKKYKM